MTDRFRYLPCGLHEALAFSLWVRSSRDGMMRDIPPGPYVIDPEGATSGPGYGLDFVDLAHPAGWDHAVRAYASIKGVRVGESESVAFRWDGEWSCWRLGDACIHDGAIHNESGDIVYGYTPTGRREALCRCICAALGLDVGVVFPVERS